MVNAELLCRDVANKAVVVTIVTDSLLIYHVKLSIHVTLFSGVFFLVAEEIGCFKDRNPDRKMGLIVSYRGKMPWKNLWKVVRDCSREAKEKK